MTDSNEQTRAAFEAEMTRHGFNIVRAGSEYLSYDTDKAWLGWRLASRQTVSEEARKLEEVTEGDQWRAMAAKHLSALIADMESEIDGGEELRGRDSMISRWIDAATKAQSCVLAALAKHKPEKGE